MISSPRILFSARQALHLSPTSFWQCARRAVGPLYEKIKHHPFNMQLVNGTLPPEVFVEYRGQDANYLIAYHDLIMRLAVGLSCRQSRAIVEQFADGCLDERDPHARTDLILPSTINYVRFLQRMMEKKSLGVVAASIMPCFDVYAWLACEMRSFCEAQKRYPSFKPYHDWITCYSSPEFLKKVEFMANLTDRLVSPRDEEEALQVVHEGTELEFQFWDGVYRHKQPQPPLLIPPSRLV